MLHLPALALTLLAHVQAPESVARIDALTLGLFALDEGRFGEARGHLERALVLGPARPAHLLQLAQSCAGTGDEAAAASYLLAAVSGGLASRGLAADARLVTLHDHPLWSALVAKAEAAAEAEEKAIRFPDLRRELLERMERDQLARENVTLLPGPDPQACPTGLPPAAGDVGHSEEGETEVVILSGDTPLPTCPGGALEEIDRDNTARLRAIVSEHGWPTRSLVGADGAKAAWLLVQHADLAPDFQRRCLELMQAAPEGEVARDHIAYLTDRVAVNSGQPQVYGTQFHSVGGKLVPRPIRDPQAVDARRANMNLSSLGIYTRHMEGNHDHGKPVGEAPR